MNSIIWIFSFISYPLLGVELFRFSIGKLQVPIFFIFLLIIGVNSLFSLCINKKKINKIYYTQKIFLLSFTTFTIFHMINMILSSDIERALIQQVKLIICLMTIVIIWFSFPKNPNLLRKLLDVMIISSTVLLFLYIYHYIFVLHAPYLSIEWDEISQYGKNQIGLYLSLSLPFVVWRSMYSGLFSPWLISLVIHIFAMFYTLSRGTWVTVAISFFSIITLYLIKEKSPKRKKQIIKSIFMIAMCIIGIFCYFYTEQISPIRFEERLNSLLALQDVGNEMSISLRKELISKALDIFSKNPLLGIGTSAFMLESGLNAHIDYLLILSEQGIIGFSMFILIIISIIKGILAVPEKFSWEILGLKQASLGAIIYLFFINAYNVLMIYVIWGILLYYENVDHFDKNPLQYNKVKIYRT